MRTLKNSIVLSVPLVFVICLAVQGGPYTERGINSYVKPNGAPANPMDPNAVINPIFRGWANRVANYEPAEPEYIEPWWMDPNMALGPSWGNTAPEDHIWDVVSLGDLYREDIDAGVPPGQITLSFSETIRNGKGYDFAVFENAIGPLCGGLYWWCELGYVEVSSNGVAFVRFPSVSLVPYNSGCYRIPDCRVIDITNVYNLAGKHPNIWGEIASGEDITGTPFDLSDLVNEPNVLNGSVDINNIVYVRIVDIPGSGDFFDDATHYIDPCTGYNYPVNHPIYDPWVTFGSGGFDLEAIGVLHPQQYRGDINLDGIVNFADFAILAGAWQKHFGQNGWISRCDISSPRDMVVDILDFAVLAEDWLKVEQWRSN
jgi:hypothetical protein